MKKVRTVIPVSRIQLNTGQIDWLPKNPRQWTQEDVNKQIASIEEDEDYLEDRPALVVRKDDKEYVVFAGNLRTFASKKMKLKGMPSVIYEPVSDEDHETVIRRAAKDNGTYGKWDWDTIANEWEDVVDKLAGWGVDIPAEWAEGAIGGGESSSNEVSEDDFDESTDEVEVRCNKGDVYQLGEHRLMCGDSTDPATVKRLMNGELADLLLTDPPYNVDYEGGTEDKMKIQNDSFKEDGEFLEFLRKAMRCASEVMKAGASYYIFHADSEGRNFREAATEIGKVRECLIWVKNSLVLGRQDYQWRHEPCLYGWKEGAGHNWFNDRSQTTVLEFDRPKRNAEHPTMKPVPLFSYLMKNSTKPGDSVLDLFAGSGTTLICAEQLDRKSYSMELDPHYCDVIIARWEKLTGKTAVKL